MDKELLKAYKNTCYRIPEARVDIFINRKNGKLDDLLGALNCTCWAFITAWNPYSKLLPEKENKERNKRLKNSLSGYVFYEGSGIPANEDWKAEESFFIAGISKKEAARLGREFGQNAIVIGQKGDATELLMLS